MDSSGDDGEILKTSLKLKAVLISGGGTRFSSDASDFGGAKPHSPLPIFIGCILEGSDILLRRNQGD